MVIPLRPPTAGVASELNLVSLNRRCIDRSGQNDDISGRTRCRPSAAGGKSGPPMHNFDAVAVDAMIVGSR
jgi:hypothetical protein